MYLGCAVVLLAACAVVVRSRFDRGAAIVMVSIAAIGVVLAAGTTGGLLPLLVDHVPGFALLRVPGRYKLLSAWTTAAAAGYGIAALEAAWGDVVLRRRAIGVAAIAVVVVTVLVAGWAMPASPKDRQAWWSIVAVVVAAGLVVVAVRGTARWSAFGFGALAIAVLLDAPAFTFVSPGALPAAEPRQVHDRDDALVARLDGVRDRWRLYDEFVLGERAGARLRVRDFRGYPAVDPISLRRYVDVLEYAKRDPAIITDYNVRWVLKRPHFRYGDNTSFVELPNPAFVDRGGGVAEAISPAPIVAWYGAATIVDHAGDALRAVRAAQDADGARRHAVVERADAAALPAGVADRLASGTPATREGSITSYQPDEVRFDIDAPADGLVVLDEIMFPGWEVEVDGVTATPVRANYLLRAVWVGQGHHAIAWRFSPGHWRGLVAGYLLALAIMIAAVATRRRRPA
jgi:hypothetical protein